jgi:hypothetical protein
MKNNLNVAEASPFPATNEWDVGDGVAIRGSTAPPSESEPYGEILPAETQDALEQALAPAQGLKKWSNLIGGLVELLFKAELVREVGPGIRPERQDEWQKKDFGPIL